MSASFNLACTSEGNFLFLGRFHMVVHKVSQAEVESFLPDKIHKKL